MKDIPVFTTENGAASLTLKEIPYTAAAYVKILSSQAPKELLDECVSFCRIAGAESVYATGDAFLEAFELHTSIIEMRCSVEGAEDTDAAVFPVQEKTLELWREHYNRKMKTVPGASWMTKQDGEALLKTGGGYFIHRDGVLLGIGSVSGERIEALASLQKGAGRDIVLALFHAVTAETAVLEVATANEKAVRLYESLGFVPAKEICRWYKIF